MIEFLIESRDLFKLTVNKTSIVSQVKYSVYSAYMYEFTNTLFSTFFFLAMDME